MASETETTTDHNQIKEWVELHDGTPATVRGTGSDADPGILRIDFPGGAGTDDLEHTTWHEWFQKFEESGLAFLYQERQERKASGEDSTFFKLVKR